MTNNIIVKKINFEERINCGKIKSKAKTILTLEINIKNDSVYDIDKVHEKPISVNTFKFDKITFELNKDSEDFIRFESILYNSFFILSTNPNHKIKSEKFLNIPGFINDYTWTNTNTLECKIFFNNFFPNNIPYYPKLSKYYLFIWFPKLLNSNLIKSSYFNVYFESKIKNNKLKPTSTIDEIKIIDTDLILRIFD
jgi:hypothetical protein